MRGGAVFGGRAGRRRRADGGHWAGHGGVTDEAWANAAKHYDIDQLAALVCAIATINAYNRFNVICQNQGGDYQPGQWG